MVFAFFLWILVPLFSLISILWTNQWVPVFPGSNRDVYDSPAHWSLRMKEMLDPRLCSLPRLPCGVTCTQKCPVTRDSSSLSGGLDPHGSPLSSSGLEMMQVWLCSPWVTSKALTGPNSPQSACQQNYFLQGTQPSAGNTAQYPSCQGKHRKGVWDRMRVLWTHRDLREFTQVASRTLPTEVQHCQRTLTRDVHWDLPT